MSHLQQVLELVGDIRDCANRARDRGFVDQASALTLAADDIEHWATHADHSPAAANAEARARASQHFAEARAILRGIK